MNSGRQTNAISNISGHKEREVMTASALMKRLMTWIVPLALLVLAAACSGGGATATPPVDPRNTLILAYDGWTGTYLPAYVMKVVFEDELGYDVRVSDQTTIPAAFESVATDRTDIFTSAWFPARDTTLDKYPNLVKVGQVYGGKDRDAFEGWMVSADFAREHRLSHVRDLSDPAVARALDSDGDGKGNLIGSPADYAAAGRHPEILADYGLAGLYEVDVPASERELLSAIEKRLSKGEPALFYIYQPVALPGDVSLDRDATWLDGTKAYLPLAFDRIVVRGDFIANNPEAAKVLTRFSIPGRDISEAMGRVIDKGASPKFLEELARAWIEQNRGEVDRWLQGIPARTPSTELPAETLITAYTPEIEGLFLKLAIEYNLSRPPGTPPVEPVQRSMGQILDQAVDGKFAAMVPDSAVWLDQLDRTWQQRNPGSSLVGSRTRFALSPIVIAMWRDTAADLGYPNEALGWDDLIRKASRDPRFKWSHSSAKTASGLLTTTAEFFAGAGNPGELTNDDLTAEASRDFVRNVESTVRQYGGESEDKVVIRMLAENGRPLDAFVAQEQSVIYYNSNSEREKLVAIYPKEGTFWMDHPLVLLDGPWVTAAQRSAFQGFATLVKTPEQQRLVLQEGYRPADLAISLQGADSLIKPEFGADPAEPKTLLKVPAAGVLESIREAWRLLKKPANIYLVVDVSGSMEGEKIRGAKGALLSFMEQIEGDRDRVALVPFSSEVKAVEPLGPADRPSLEARILGLKAGGGTALYDAVAFAYEDLQAKGDSDHINVIVAMTDGQSSGNISVIESKVGGERLPVVIFTVGYGSDADFDVLQRIARLGEGQAYPSDEETIEQLYELLSAFF